MIFKLSSNKRVLFRLLAVLTSDFSAFTDETNPFFSISKSLENGIQKGSEISCCAKRE